MEICSHEKCTGCRACVQICPTHAITMKLDDNGFYYPDVDVSHCQSCGLCAKVCTGNHPPEGNLPLQVYACWNKHKKDRKRSTSGGVFFALAQQIIARGGVVFGAAWIENGVQHIKCETLNELKQLQGSKYLQSNIGNSYLQAKELLESDRTVLFSGTPCQIAALHAFLKKEYKRLYTVEVVCHGVPSEKPLSDHIKELESDYKDRIVRIRYRVKHPNWVDSAMEYQFSDGKKVYIPFWKDFFACGFVNNYYLRPSCYQCAFSKPKRNADLTICDFWGYKVKHLKMYGYTDGISALMINTPSGNALFDLTKDNLILEKRTLQEVAAKNRNLSAPQKKPDDIEQFQNEYGNGRPFSELAIRYFPGNLKPNYSIKSRIKLFIRLMLNDVVFFLKGGKT